MTRLRVDYVEWIVLFVEKGLVLLITLVGFQLVGFYFCCNSICPDMLFYCLIQRHVL